MIILYKIIS